jgi:D-xylonolactonase
LPATTCAPCTRRTARKGLSAEELAQQPLAGALFTFRAETAGLPHHVLRLQE